MKGLIGGLVGVVVILTPLNDKIKMSLVLVSAIPGTYELLANRHRQKRALEASADDQAKTTQLKKDALKEVETLRTQAQADLATQKAGMDTAKAIAEQEILTIKTEANTLKENATKLLEQTERDRQALLFQAQKTADEIAASTATKYQEWEAQLKAKQAVIDSDLQELEQIKADIEILSRTTEAERIRILAKAEAQSSIALQQKTLELERRLSELANLESETNILLEKEKSKWATELAQAQIQLSQEQANSGLEMQQWQQQAERDAQQIIANATTEAEGIKAAAYNEAMAAVEEDSVTYQADIKKQITDQLVAPHIAKIKKLEEEVREVKNRLAIAYERIQRAEKPIKPQGLHPRQTAGRELIDFYYQRGILLDCVNTYITPNDIRVIVKPRKDVKLKQLQEHTNTIVHEIGLVQPPVIGVVDEGYEFVLVPVNMSFFGLKPNVTDHDALYSYTPKELQEPTSSDRGYRLAAEQLAKYEKERYMMSFIPPESNLPRMGEIQPLELDYVDWLINWRYKATGQPNYSKQNDIIEALWGVRPGHSSDIVQYELSDSEKITLRDRLHMIFERLGISYKSR